MAEKDTIQAEIDRNLTTLSANASTLHSPLLDRDGFPRADIDVFAVRHARVRIIELRNDLNATMDKIKAALENVYQRDETAVKLASEVERSVVTPVAEPPKVESKPFARVDGIFPGSPASTAVCALLVLGTRIALLTRTRRFPNRDYSVRI